MKNKASGFTLIELLGVIIILSLLMLITVPKIVNPIRSSKNKVDDLTKKLIYNATDIYINERIMIYPKNTQNTYCIPLINLIASGYLKEPINIDDVDITNTASVEVTYDGEYNFEIKNTNSCIQTIVNPDNDNDDDNDAWVCEPNIQHQGIVYGDFNDDGIVDNTDLVLLNRANTSKNQLENSIKDRMDLNLDCIIDSDDSNILAAYLVNIIKRLPYTG